MSKDEKTVETPVKETVADVVAPKTMLINISHQIDVNGIKYEPGDHELPEDLAREVTRIDREYTDSLAKLHIKHEYMANAGTTAVGGGAQ